ncbi:alpha/beta hydrolase-fold protein [Aureisphaera galaxeae]|uniref:alpha/beta hydrolase-fold protein n=1 Tax=Aureisphaera galaxeae TaxID=1538023 RepID=UPI002350E90B|nr:alpha/beta hydrolase-fold protein [Aureisphaera galaxeae]MDC8002857.1 alpha/beta hydrolase-fold protein [Aureisphaera galaxeae]
MNNKHIFCILALFISIGASSQSSTETEFLFQFGVKDSIHSQVLNENRTFWIQLPNGGNLEEGVEYPVLYLLDGRMHFDAIAATLNHNSPAWIPSMIVVGISNRENRNRDLTTSKVTHRRGFPFRGESGEADKFIQFLKDELIPYIDATFPTLDYRTLVGHSYGGLFTINAFLKHTDLFNNYLAIDPSLDWDNQKLLKESKGILKKKTFDNTSLFITLANGLFRFREDLNVYNVMTDTTDVSLGMRSNFDFIKTIQSAKKDGIKFSWKLYENQIHGTVPLISIHDGLREIFTWYRLENAHIYNNLDIPTEDLVDVISYREEKLSKHFGKKTPPFEENLLNMLGYMSMDSGNMGKAKKIFELNMEYYPTSANVYDSMADYYIAQKDKKNALTYLRKAFEISNSEAHKKKMEDILNMD